MKDFKELIIHKFNKDDGATIFYGDDYHPMAILGHEASGVVPDGYDSARISVVVSS